MTALAEGDRSPSRSSASSSRRSRPGHRGAGLRRPAGRGRARGLITADERTPAEELRAMAWTPSSWTTSTPTSCARRATSTDAGGTPRESPDRTGPPAGRFLCDGQENAADVHHLRSHHRPLAGRSLALFARGLPQGAVLRHHRAALRGAGAGPLRGAHPRPPRGHNHLGTVHAIALCNLAELVGGVMTDATHPGEHALDSQGHERRAT